jgi:hypothetical protein
MFIFVAALLLAPAKKFVSTATTNAIAEGGVKGAGATEDLIAQSLADPEREWTYLGSNIDWKAVSEIARKIFFWENTV